VEDVSRELCGGTHVANTAEVGILAIVSEGSSAANVRRIEALTGPAAIDWYRARSDELREVGDVLGLQHDPVDGARQLAERLRELSRVSEEQAARSAGELARTIAAGSTKEVDGIAVLIERTDAPDSKLLLQLAERIKSSLGDAAVVLGSATDGRVALVASFTDAAVERGLSAADVVREAAEVVGGGGGGRPNVAQAGGRDTGRLDEALEVARKAIEKRLGA
jgi:alanyl-tRNA synthetase